MPMTDRPASQHLWTVRGPSTGTKIATRPHSGPADTRYRRSDPPAGRRNVTALWGLGTIFVGTRS